MDRELKAKLVRAVRDITDTKLWSGTDPNKAAAIIKGLGRKFRTKFSILQGSGEIFIRMDPSEVLCDMFFAELDDKLSLFMGQVQSLREQAGEMAETAMAIDEALESYEALTASKKKEP